MTYGGTFVKIAYLLYLSFTNCTRPMNPMIIDNQITHATPEGIRLSLTPARIAPRMMAWLIDALIRGLLLVLSTVFWAFGEAGVGLMLVTSFLVMWLYPVLFEVLRDGQTIGKKSSGLRVCMDNGMPISWQASMIRNLLIVADFLPMMFLSGLIAMLFSRSGKRLGDIVAGTMVVRTPKIQAMSEPIAHRPILPPIGLTLEEQRALLSFVERAPMLPSDRVEELVGILAPMTGKATLSDAGDELVGYANAITGAEEVLQTPANSRLGAQIHQPYARGGQ